MDRPAINPATVEWAGDNPAMYLRESAGGSYVSLISVFRIAYSPHGQGNAAFVFEDPRGEGKSPEKRNACITDNEPLARYLRDNFLSRFPAFKGLPALATCSFDSGRNFRVDGDLKKSHTERFESSGGLVTLTWRPLGDVFMVAMPKDRSATGEHEIFSVIVNASDIETSVYGRSVAGRPFRTDVAGKPSSTAFVALSETWLRP